MKNHSLKYHSKFFKSFKVLDCEFGTLFWTTTEPATGLPTTESPTEPPTAPTNYTDYEDYIDFTEFRFESPISISKLNNHSDFRRKSENYFKVKVFQTVDQSMPRNSF